MRSFCFIVLLLPYFGWSQTREQRLAYDSLKAQGNLAYQQQDFGKAGQCFLDAIQAFGDRGFPEDRYMAAQSLAKSARFDPAFANLFRLLDKSNYLEYFTLISDSLLAPLHADTRWGQLVERLRPEMPDLARRLMEIRHRDQDLRNTLGETRKKFGAKSPQMDSLWARINFMDSINLLEIRQILDTVGWPGPKQIGNQGNTTIWLVIQHADISTQEHYLPMMQAAADNGKASCENLAFLEDRILVRKKKPQWYGTQQFIPNASNESHYFPVEDPNGLNYRRLSMGMPPFSEAQLEAVKMDSAPK